MIFSQNFPIQRERALNFLRILGRGVVSPMTSLLDPPLLMTSKNIRFSYFLRDEDRRGYIEYILHEVLERRRDAVLILYVDILCSL